MRLNLAVAVLIIAGWMIAQRQDSTDLAFQLANRETRQSAVTKVVASGANRAPFLLSWTRHPPVGVDRYQLNIGLADAFGALGTKEAIPFLIENISLSRWGEVNIWLKKDSVIEENLPAVAALIKMGPAASSALIRAASKPMLAEDRLPLIFVISRVKDPEARGFLVTAMGEANIEHYWAEEGLKLLDSAH